MAAVSISLAFSADSLNPSRSAKFGLSSSSRYPSLFSCRSHRSSNVRFAFPPSPHSSSVTTATETGGEEATKSTGSYDFLEESFRTGRFLSNAELEKLKALEGFAYFQELESGSMWVRVMRAEEMDSTVKLLAESFGESMLLPSGYQSVLRFLVKQYLIERREVLPHAVTLVGFYRKKSDSCSSDGEEAEMAGTVEVCFDKRGANASPPSPTPPKESPYVCNMTVKEDLRRRGIGWHLLKASEELISQLSPSKDVYLHCRMVDEAPFKMYRKAGYEVVKTDTILILLMLQRRKHLMRKKLPPCTIIPSDTVEMLGSDNELTSSANV
uniref:N-acetyltransferase domain-containing protein n=1 Tax=Noccaea caerulescens TaxID=107243 RepID=A0A1J3EJW0_NOCCA